MPAPDDQLQPGIGAADLPQGSPVGEGDAVVSQAEDVDLAKKDKTEDQPARSAVDDRGNDRPALPYRESDPSSKTGDERRYYFLARGLCILIGLFLVATLIQLFIDALRRGSTDSSPIASCIYLFLDNLLHTPSIAYLACGLAGAMVSEVHRAQQGAFSQSRIVCDLAIGAITGLVFAYAVKAGLTDALGSAKPTSTGAPPSDPLPVKYFVIAVLAGYGGQRAFEWLYNKLTK